jgi:hypothetical protein
LSAGLEDFRIEKYVKIDAKKSLIECTASDIMLILPDKIPATNFTIIIVAFDITDNIDANFFSYNIFIA